MRECAAAPGRGQGLLQGTRRQDHGVPGCSIVDGGLSTVCPCACFCTHCLAGGMHAYISSAGSVPGVGVWCHLQVCVFRWIRDLHDFLRPASDCESNNLRGGNVLIRSMSLLGQRRLCTVQWASNNRQLKGCISS